MSNLNSIKKEYNDLWTDLSSDIQNVMPIVNKKEQIPLPLNSFFPIQMYAALSL